MGLFTSRKEKKAAEIALVKSENVFIQERTETLKGLNEARDKALTAITKVVSAPTMSVNQELYSNTGNKYQSDIWMRDHAYTRRKSRIAEYESPPAQAMIGRFVDMVIGPKLNLQASPVWDLIPGATKDQKARQDFIKNIEIRWKLWVKKKNVTNDKQYNYHRLSRELFKDLLIDGEYFVLLRYSGSRKKNPLTLEYISPDNIMRISSTVVAGNTEVDGIEYDKDNVAVAYHIKSDVNGTKSVRVSTVGSRSQRIFMIHNTIGRGRRGVGILAGIITELVKLADFQVLEIQAAVINSLFAVWVETGIGGDNKPIMNKDGIQGAATATNARDIYDQNDFEAQLSKTSVSQGGIIAQNMGEGQKLHSFDTKRPTANFTDFMKSSLRILFAAKGMSYSMAMYDPDASYSAIRAEFLTFWKRVMTLRFDQSTDWDSPVYQMWLWGEVDRGKIIMSGWQDEEIRDAWSNSAWIGPQRPDIDPLRSAKAAEVDSKHAWKTDQELSAERGSGNDWDENIVRKKTENEKKAAANKPLVEQEKTTFSNSKNITKSTTIEGGDSEELKEEE